MADQEFLASFAVDIDEAGVARLQKILTDNKGLADNEKRVRINSGIVTDVIPSKAACGRAEGSPRSSDVPLPLLRDVPVYLPEDREISPGEFALVVFADCDIDAWFETGEVSVPVSSRQHDLSDAFAFVGFRSGHQVSS